MKKLSAGVTLTELLIVIAIITVLAAILFPILARARGAAVGTDDISKMHQLGLAYAMYSEQYGDPEGDTGRLVASGVAPAYLLQSKLDPTEKGMGTLFINGIPGAPQANYKRTFLGYGDLTMKSWLWHQQCDNHNAQGWLFDLAEFERTPAGSDVIPRGMYKRLLTDASVQVRSIAPLEGKDATGHHMTSIQYHDFFCDPN